MLSPKPDLVAARLFLRLALWQSGAHPGVINVDRHPAYARAISDLKESRELGQRCRYRPGCLLKQYRPKLFRGRHFQDEIIILCVRWYLRYSLSYRDLEEVMAERGLRLDHSTIARWVLRYAPELSKRIARYRYVHAPPTRT